MQKQAMVLAAAIAAFASAGYAADQKVTLKNLPAAVKATVDAESKGATIKGISSEMENGKKVYELETLVNGRTRDLMIDGAGKVYVVEEQLDADKAPAPVKAALEARGRILRLESVQENGRTRYEGQVQTKAGKKVAVEVDADGKPYKK
ncbi:MAG: hypothetical protein ABIQ52_06600 [Vicinamibacterales bacterium]